MKKKYFLYFLLLCSQLCYGQVKDSVLFGKIRVQSSSSICLQGESLRIELAVANRTDDSIVITFRFTNRGNKIIGIERWCGVDYYEEETQKVSFWGNLFSFICSPSLADYDCNIECIVPGEHYEFTATASAPKYKTIYIQLLYILDIAFLVEKKVLHLNSQGEICYPRKNNWDFLELFMLNFEKNSQEIDMLLPIKGCLCEPTLTPTKD